MSIGFFFLVCVFCIVLFIFKLGGGFGIFKDVLGVFMFFKKGFLIGSCINCKMYCDFDFVFICLVILF